MEGPNSPRRMSDSGTTEKIKKDAADATQDVKQQAREQVDVHKDNVADKTRSVAAAVERVAQEFRHEDQQSLAQYAGELAGEMKNFADNLRGRSVDELLRDTQEFARRNPAAFLLGSVAVGFALTRFAKASAQPSSDRRHTPTHAGTHPADESVPLAPSVQTPAFEDLNS